MMAKKTETPQQRYEAKGKRPGVPVGTRLSDAELKLFDAEMAKEGLEARGAFLRKIIAERCRFNEPPPKRKKK